MKKLMLVPLIMIASDAFGETRWVVEVKNERTAEVRTFQPPEEDWKIPDNALFPGLVSAGGCIVTKISTVKSKSVRAIQCQKAPNVIFQIAAGCSKWRTIPALLRISDDKDEITMTLDCLQ